MAILLDCGGVVDVVVDLQFAAETNTLMSVEIYVFCMQRRSRRRSGRESKKRRMDRWIDG